MAPPTLRIIITLALFVHGAGHTLGCWMPARSWLLPGVNEPAPRVSSDGGAVGAPEGNYYQTIKYLPAPLPVFDEAKTRLPAPIFDENSDYIACYWKTWELAFQHFRQPASTSRFVSNYIDEGFNEGLFLWDSSFMTMFCNYGYPIVPGICTLDNFYCSQLPDGEIVREMDELTGEPRTPWSRPGTPDSLNHPILAWAELESYRITGDRTRLARVYPPLVSYYRAYEKIKDRETGFYRTSWASMDNSPRNEGMLCGIDTTSEVAAFARDLAVVARILGKKKAAAAFSKEADELAARINEKLWDEETGFYYDWSAEGNMQEAKTIAAFWTLRAGVPDKERAARLVDHLNDPAEFKRAHRVPTVPADQPGYDPTGGYWCGAVWSPTTMMVVRGLERYGYAAQAREIALNHLSNVARVFKDTGTIWENYAPDSIMRGNPSSPDFVGWSGIAPTAFFIEYGIGIKADAASNAITWTVTSPKRVGIERFRFGGNTVSLICAEADVNGKRAITITSEKPFVLKIGWNGKQMKIRVPGNAGGRAPYYIQ